MATVSHTIYSHYDPPEPKPPICDSDHPEEPSATAESDSWHFDPTFKPPPAPPPRFVPASLPPPNWDCGNAHASSSSTPSPSTKDVSNWYRSLTSSRPEAPLKSQSQPKPPSPGCRTTPAHPDTRTSETKNKNNWFIMNAIHSDPAAQIARSASCPTLADIIGRDPPPRPTEGQFKPPVWLEIGPSNRGFAMLQRSGWSEGEPLGSDVIRQPTIRSPHADMILSLENNKGKDKFKAEVKQEMLEASVAGYDDVTGPRRIDVVDLTLSDSDQEVEDAVAFNHLPGTVYPTRENDPHGRTALLTPIATKLKSDRLGIGLKAKTVGPYKASLKRVTHNAAAMAAHIRSAEESRRRQQKYGRGQRGFAVQRKREELDRTNLLAYMKD